MSALALIFPGQGSQTVGMLQELASRFPVITDTFTQVSERLGYDVWALVQEGPESRLNQTEHTQVSMLTADIAVYQLLQQQGMKAPSMMAGHSLGEYAALVASSSLSLTDAAWLVAHRGRLMQETVPLGEGAMAAILGLSDEDVQNICKEVSNTSIEVSPANYNAIGQVVIAGHTTAVKAAIERALEMKARLAIEIPVSVPCHCALLKDAAHRFEEFLATITFKIPHLPVISNVDLSIYETPTQIQKLLKQQLYSPVRWVETIQLMKTQGVESLIECGPGKVLSGLVKRIDRSLKVSSVNDLYSFDGLVGEKL